ISFIYQIGIFDPGSRRRGTLTVENAIKNQTPQDCGSCQQPGKYLKNLPIFPATGGQGCWFSFKHSRDGRG
ncbi:MAG TPA: hypothetical protein VEH09_11230, partial [Thermodesulfobacteriota bacterium]|nr:hypothetical protein [Thermodesulfobacteriota bacterium]